MQIGVGVAEGVLEEMGDTLLLVLGRAESELELDRMILVVSLAMEDDLDGMLLVLVSFAVLLSLDPVVDVSAKKADVVALSAELEEVVVAKYELDELVISWAVLEPVGDSS